MQAQQVEFRSTRYYQLINVAFKQALYINSGSKKFQQQRGYLSEPSQQRLGQLWQVIQIKQNILYRNCFQIVHARSTLVLTNVDQKQVKLRFGQQKPSQLFHIHKVSDSNQGAIYTLGSIENKQNYLHYDKMIKVSEIEPSNKRCQWYINPVSYNQIINRSCYFQNSYDNLVIDVPMASHSTGCNLIQYYFNNRFNQRFNISVIGQEDQKQFRIENINSKLFLTSHKKCREGDKITQQKNDPQSRQQKWFIEYQGKNLFVIRSAVNPQMMIGTKDAWYNFQKPIITTSNQEFALWKIVGFLPKREQLTEI